MMYLVKFYKSDNVQLSTKKNTYAYKIQLSTLFRMKNVTLNTAGKHFGERIFFSQFLNHVILIFVQ